jgi:ABC-2 type transport system permease protein
MKQIMALCLFEVQRVFKQRKNWILMVVMPLVFTLVFGGLTGDGANKVKVALVDQEGTKASQALADRLAKSDMLEISRPALADAQGQLDDGKVSALIVIPEKYEGHLLAGEKTEVTFRHGPGLGTAPAISGLIDDAMAQAAIQVQAAKTWSQHSGDANWQGEFDRLVAATATPQVSVEAATVAKDAATKEMNNASQRAIGFSIMFVMIGLTGVTGTILDARKTGVWYRMLSTPASRLQVLTGYLLSFLITGWVQFGILMVTSSLFFDVAWGNVLGEFVLVTSMLLCMVGLGLFLAGFVKSTEQQSALGSIIIISTCMLGGIYWPLDIVSDTMRRIADFVPQTWMMQGFTELIARGGTLADIVAPVSVLLGFACVFLIGGLSRIRYE